MNWNTCGLMQRSLMILSCALAVWKACASEDFDWSAAAVAGGGRVTIADGQTATVTDDDIPAFANITNISCEGTTSRVLFKNANPLTVNAEFSGPGGNDANPAVIEMIPGAGKVTFAKKVYFSDKRKIVLGNSDIYGLFGSYRTAGYYGSIEALAGCVVDFKAGSSLQRQYYTYLRGRGTFKFACKIPTTQPANQLFVSAGGTFVMNGDSLLNAVGMAVEDAGVFVLDMNGHPQGIGSLSGSYLISSATPAVFTCNASATTDTSASLCFDGQVSYDYSSPRKTTVSGGVSTTAGTLNVKAGNLVLSGEAAWRGGLVSVTGGKLTLGGAAVLGTEVDVSVSENGVLEIPTNIVCSAKSLTIGGESIDISSVISFAALASLYPQHITGDGCMGNVMVRYVSTNGSDSADGKTESTPWKTFSRAFSEVYPGGSKVIVLPGVYDYGEMTKAGIVGACRIVIPDGLTVVSRDGAGTTTIAGQSATVPLWNGCGVDSLRCAYVGKKARLEGFTLCGGRAYKSETESSAGGGVYAPGSGYSPDDAWVVDCVITNCAAPGTGGAAQYGKFLRCRVLDCATPSYSAGIRCGAAYNCYFSGLPNNGFLDAASGSPAGVACVGNTFVYSGASPILAFTGTVIGCLFAGNVSANTGAATQFENCIFTTGAVPASSTGATTNGTCRVVSDLELALDETGRPRRSSVAVNAGIRAEYEAAMPVGESGKDASGGSRFVFGGLDVGAYEYDPRADFSLLLGFGVTVTSVSDGVVDSQAGGSVVIPAGEEMSLDWELGRAPVTQFTFDVSVESGAVLSVYNGEALVEVVTESKTVNFVSDDVVRLRLAVTGVGSVEVSSFLNDTTAVVLASAGGVELSGATFGTNYLEGAEMSFTLRRTFDSFDRYSSGFTSNGFFHSWSEYPEGWSYTLSDRRSSITVVAVYETNLSDWYVSPGGDDEENFGRHPSNRLKTLAKAASLAKSGDTIHAAAGVYNAGVMACESTSAPGLRRVVVPDGVSLVAEENPSETVISGAMAEPADARVLIGGCGTNSVACVYLGANSTLRGFTLKDGYGYAAPDGSTGTFGGGVNAVTTAKAVGCIITNCYAIGGAGAHGGNYMRCQIVGNRSYWDYRTGMTDIYRAVNCYLRDNMTYDGRCQGQLTAVNAWVVNCTFEGLPAFRSNNTAPTFYNCLFLCDPCGHIPPEQSVPIVYSNCLATVAIRSTYEALTRWDEDCSVDSTLALGADHAPLDGASPMVDSEPARSSYLELASAFFGEDAESDLNGGQRVYNARLDIGAAEYDWRGTFARILSNNHTNRVSVVAASANVQSSGDALKLPEGTLSVTCTGESGVKYSFEVRQYGEGELSVSCGGERLTPLSAADGLSSYSFVTTTDQVDLEFAFEGPGYVDLSQLRRTMGVVVIVR